MVRALVTAALLAIADANCVGNLAPFVFRDPHDGDMKVVTAHVFDFMIQPYDKSSEDWTVYGTFDLDCVATVDFNVPGKPNPPPNNLTMALWVMGSNDDRLQRLGLEFTDPMAADPTEPVNLWVLDHWPQFDSTVGSIVGPKVKDALDRVDATVGQNWCIIEKKAILGDMHDGDKKAVKISGSREKERMQITPYGSGESWSVTADLNDNNDCKASVDFNVPGKPNPPPVPLDARIWGMVCIKETEKDKTAILFQDPSGTIDEPSALVNVWVENNAEKSVIV